MQAPIIDPNAQRMQAAQVASLREKALKLAQAKRDVTIQFINLDAPIVFNDVDRAEVAEGCYTILIGDTIKRWPLQHIYSVTEVLKV